MHMKQTDETVIRLLKEITRLKNRNTYLSGKLAALEKRHGIRGPVLSLTFGAKPVRLIVWMDMPLIYANDVLPFVAADLPEPSVWGSTFKRLNDIGLSAREVMSVNRVDLSDAWLITCANVCASIGAPASAPFIPFLTPLGIETLEPYAPKF